jgi:TPR repeat protein
MKLTALISTVAIATMLGSTCGIVWGQIPRSGQRGGGYGNGGLITTRSQADAAADAQRRAKMQAIEEWAQEQADALARAQAAAQAAAKQAEWEAFRGPAVAKLTSERDEAITNLRAKYSPVITDLESQVAALEQKARDIETNNTVWVTNFVKLGPNHRVVNGQPYDSYHSELWKNPLELAGFHSHPNANFRLVTYLARIETVERDKIMCGVYGQAHWPPVANGEVEGEDLVREIVIYHYPNAESLVSGQYLGDCRCMRVANYNDNGISYEAYDCGVQATNDVTEVVPARLDAATVKKIEDIKNQLSPIELKLSHVQRDSDKENEKINLEYEAKIKDVPNLYAKHLKDIADEKKRAAQDKIIKWNQGQADKGDPIGLLRMGEFYRDGDGVPKDLDKAREYLTKASAAGSPSAADELSKLNQVSTNAPASP